MTEKKLRPEWKNHIKKLDKLTTEIYESKNFSRVNLIDRLAEIFDEDYKELDVDVRIIVLIEFCFFKAGGPYSRRFGYFSEILCRIIALYPELQKILNGRAVDLITKMVLNEKSGLKFKIFDNYELRIVLDLWKKMGLKPISIESVFNAVMQKRSVILDLKEKNSYLLALLKKVFPFYEKYYLPNQIDLNKGSYEQERKRFDNLIIEYKNRNLSLNDIIQKENSRDMPTEIKRNNFLSYLLKKKHKFRCQICQLTKSKSKTHYFEAHHIVPLGQGGANHSSNMIVLCKKHHNEAHSGTLEIICKKNLTIKYKRKQFGINNN